MPAWSNLQGKFPHDDTKIMKLLVAELLLEPKKAKQIESCTDIACGAEFTMWLCAGRLYSAGLPQYGQLGHGTDHEYNAKDCELPHFQDHLLCSSGHATSYHIIFLSHACLTQCSHTIQRSSL